MAEIRDVTQEERVVNRNNTAVAGELEISDVAEEVSNIEIAEASGNGGDPSENATQEDMAGEAEVEVVQEATLVDTREALEMLSKEPGDLSRELARLKKSKKPEDRALATDFEMAQKQMELTELESQIAQSANKGLSESEKTRMGRRREELKGEINSMGEQRKGITNEGEAIPNQVESLTKKMGITETDNPLGEITSEFKQLLKMDPTQRKKAYVRYGESGMTNDETKFLEDAIKAIGNKEKLKRVANLAKKGAAFSLIFMVIMMIKSFEESGEGGSPRQ